MVLIKFSKQMWLFHKDGNWSKAVYLTKSSIKILIIVTAQIQMPFSYVSPVKCITK